MPARQRANSKKSARKTEAKRTDYGGNHVGWNDGAHRTKRHTEGERTGAEALIACVATRVAGVAKDDLGARENTEAEEFSDAAYYLVAIRQ